MKKMSTANEFKKNENGFGGIELKERKKAAGGKEAYVPIWEKSNLTLEEAAAYSNIGMGRLRELSNKKNCNFVLFVGTKRLIKRKKLDEFTEKASVL